MFSTLILARASASVCAFLLNHVQKCEHVLAEAVCGLLHTGFADELVAHERRHPGHPSHGLCAEMVSVVACRFQCICCVWGFSPNACVHSSQL